jgi:antitoxin VapB
MSGVKEGGAPVDHAPVRHAPVRAKLFQHGGSQAVRLPKAFRFEGSEVTVRRDGEAVILEPVKKRRIPTREEMDAFWVEIDSSGGADFPDRDQPRPQERDYW